MNSGHASLFYKIHHLKSNKDRDFPGGAAVKNLSANAGDICSSPGSGRSLYKVTYIT